MKRAGKSDIYVGRRYGEFVKLHKRLRIELPGKILPPLPRKNKSSTQSAFLSVGGDDDASSVSSVSTQNTGHDDGASMRGLVGMGHRRSASVQSGRSSRRPSGDFGSETVVLYRETQRVSLRAFLRTILQNQQIAESKAIKEFLTADPLKKLNEEELGDIERRKAMDEKRVEEQKQFYEIARQRARELDVYMERFRRDIVESSTCDSLI